MTNMNAAATHACRTCCYWSELIAKTRGGVLVAMCLAERGPRAWRYTRDDAKCTAWDEAREGAVDDPETGHLALARILDSSDPELPVNQDPDAQAMHA
jgi:hypothetical protein